MQKSQMAILKKIPLFVLISLLLLLFQTAIASASTAQSTPEETAEMFLETRMQSLVTQNADDIVPFFAESEEAELYLLFNQNELLSMYLIPMAESNYKYENVVPKVLINSINVTGNTAVVAVSYTHLDVYKRQVITMIASVIAINKDKSSADIAA